MLGQTANCNLCNARVPLALLVDHLAEHGVADHATLIQQIKDAPIVVLKEQHDG